MFCHYTVSKNIFHTTKQQVHFLRLFLRLFDKLCVNSSIVDYVNSPETSLAETIKQRNQAPLNKALPTFIYISITFANISILRNLIKTYPAPFKLQNQEISTLNLNTV